jgi:hypothetical protein
MVTKSANARHFKEMPLVKLLMVASGISHQKNHLSSWINALISSKITMTEVLLIPALLMMNQVAESTAIASGTNAGLTSVNKILHAAVTMPHIASNPTDNSTQVLAELTRLNKSSVFQLQTFSCRIEIKLNPV